MKGFVPRKAKHQAIFEQLQSMIVEGRVEDGARLPSEAELVGEHGVSRPTAARALRDLERLGLAVRRVGSGTYAKLPSSHSGTLLGLLIPGLGEIEIFEPICKRIAREAQSHGHI